MPYEAILHLRISGSERGAGVELQDLRCFLAVSQQLSFTRAASSLHITQPTLSRRIRDLEVELGTQLFDRGYHDVTLTDKGLILQKEAYEILSAILHRSVKATLLFSDPNFPCNIGP